MKRNSIFVAALAILTAACSQDAEEFTKELNAKQSSVPVSFNASFGNATTRATDTAFETGDMIGVWAVSSSATLKYSENFADNVTYRFTNGSFTPTNSGITLPSDGKGLSYYAVYPYSNEHSNTSNIQFTLKTDQSTHAAYTSSDVCTAKTELTASREVTLPFYHAMSRVMIRLSGSQLANKRVSARLKNVGYSGYINLMTQKITTYSTLKEDIKMLETSKNVFVAVVPPQQITIGTPILVVTIDGKDLEPLKLDYDLTLKSGKQATIDVTYTESSGISVGGSIHPWIEEGSVPSNVVPYDLQEKIMQYMPLYTGTTPPNLEITSSNGAILFSPAYTVYCSDYQDGNDGGYEPGYIINPIFYGFYNQSSDTNTLSIQMAEFFVENDKIQVTSYETAETAYICGNGSYFTACYNTEGVTTGMNGNQINYKTATVISGTKTSTGISNMYHAFLMISKTGDTNNDLMNTNEFRVFKDQDGTSEYVEIDLTENSRRMSNTPHSTLNTPWSNSAIANNKR